MHIYSSSFVQGIVGTALKKDNVSKHSNSDMHGKACNLERRPTMTLSQIYRSTPIGRAVSSASSEEMERVSKLFDVVYVVAKEDMAFTIAHGAGGTPWCCCWPNICN